ncbi:FG-GAP-like repeat-containing protein [Terriglobus roseus]|uniref:FG-GAP-like repeat-containing protein n=1 Tax=Terriglobus roseus TaxID=392734 RepID=UPI001FCDCDC7
MFDASNGVVSRGQVKFYDGSRLVGTSQIITQGAGPIGNAVLRTRFGGGSHSLKAIFSGVTNLGNNSQSVVQVLTVSASTPGGVAPTYSMTLAASPSLSTPPYTLTASITANTPTAPAGTVSFQDLYTSSEIATAPLVAGPTQSLNYVQGSAPVATTVTGLPAYDYNSDGIVDLLSVESSTGVVSLALGNGDGTFKSPTVLYTQSAGSPALIADFNADGNLDVLLLNALLLGRGDGTFVQGPTPPSLSSASVLGDFDRDGATDYAFVNAGNLYVSYGNGDGTFQTPIAQGSIGGTISNGASASADFNGDGIDDVVTTVFHGDGVLGNDLVMLLSNGNRTFQPYRAVNPSYNGARAFSITPGDFNGDGITDLAYIRPTFTHPFQTTAAVYVNLGVGDGTFQPGVNLTDAITWTPQSVATGDLNGDGRLDLVFFDGSVNFLFGQGDGTFARNAAIGPYTSSSTGGAIVTADLNSDGMLDVIVSKSTFLASAISSATATVSNLTLAGGGIHQVTAQYSPDGISIVKSNTINLSGTQSNTVLAGSGFSPAMGLHLNGSAALNGAKLRLTDGQQYQAGSAWSTSPLYMRSFSTSFDFQITNPDADGFTLTLQNSAPTALGSVGGELGFNFIPNSVALKFDLYNNAGEGANSVGVYAAGDTLTGPGTMLPSNIDLHSGHQFYAQVTYTGSKLVLVLRDTSTNASYTFTKNNIDLVQMIGSDYAYVGFTGATGGLTSTVDILDWFYTPKVTIYQPNSSDPVSTNGSAVTTSNGISLVDGGQGEAGSAWSTTPVNINNFDVTFNASVQNNTSGPAADGFTFTLQNSGPTALGTGGGELGFNFIPNSIAFKFDLYNNSGEGAPSVGLFNAGDTLTGASTVLPASINLVGSNNYELKYDGTTLTMIINPGATNTFTYKTQVNLRNAVQGNTAYIGFTAGTGALTSAIQIYSWNTTLGIN